MVRAIKLLQKGQRTMMHGMKSRVKSAKKKILVEAKSLSRLQKENTTKMKEAMSVKLDKES